MKKTTETIGAFIFIAGAILMGLAFITSIGVGLYFWAHTMAFPQAAWAGFLIWLKMIIGGLVLLSGGFMMGGTV